MPRPAIHNGATKRSLVNLAFVLCFFPWLRIFPIDAETQPVAGIVGLIIVILYGVKRNPFSVTLFWFIFLVGGYYGISAVRRPHLLLEVSIQTIAYVLPLFVFLAIYDKLHLLSIRLYFGAFLLWITLGILQYFDCFSFLRPILDTLLGHVISRYRSVPIGGSRGVLFWGPEPAIASKVIILFAASGGFFFSVGRINGRSFAAVLLGTIFMTVLNKSGTGSLILAVFLSGMLWGYFAGLMRSGNLTSLVSVSIIVVLGCLLTLCTFAWMSREHYQSRLFEIAQVTHEFLAQGQKVSWPKVYDLLTRVGTNRFPALYAGYASLYHGYGLGRGTGSWLTDTSESVRECAASSDPYHGLKWKPSSYASAVALDMGFPGLIALLIFLSRFLLVATKSCCQPLARAVIYGMALVAVLHILALDILSVPTPWLLLAYIQGMRGRLTLR